MSEENESSEGGMSAVKKAILGAITTAVTAGGAWFATHLGGEEPKEEAKTEQAAPAAAPVINLNLENNNTNQQKQQSNNSNSAKAASAPVQQAAPAPAPAQKESW